VLLLFSLFSTRIILSFENVSTPRDPARVERGPGEGEGMEG
jgi:hypothetical protein